MAKDIPDVLTSKFAPYVLMLLKENPGMSKSDVTNHDAGSARTKFVLLGKLIDQGFIRVDDASRQHNTMYLYLTPTGERAATLFGLIADTCADGSSD